MRFHTLQDEVMRGLLFIRILQYTKRPEIRITSSYDNIIIIVKAIFFFFLRSEFSFEIITGQQHVMTYRYIGQRHPDRRSIVVVKKKNHSHTFNTINVFNHFNDCLSCEIFKYAMITICYDHYYGYRRNRKNRKRCTVTMIEMGHSKVFSCQFRSIHATHR